MSISSIGGASGSGGLISQMLAAMLSRVQEAQAQQFSAPESSASSTATSQAAPGSVPAQATGSDTSTLSDQVMGLLVMMQDQSQGGVAPGSPAGGADPVQQAFSGIDTDGDGAISQSELESTIEKLGGTAAQADAVYSTLGGTNGISQNQFASAVQAGASAASGGPGGVQGHHHHHHHGAKSSASNDAAQIFSAMDGNGDGSVSSDELSAALGSTDGSSASAMGSSSNIFSAIDANGDGAISGDEFSTYLTDIQNQSQSDQNTRSAFSSLANQSYNSTLNLLSPAATGQTVQI